jgi:hypothetical protein
MWSAVIYVNRVSSQSSKTGVYKKGHGKSLKKDMEADQSLIPKEFLLD